MSAKKSQGPGASPGSARSFWVTCTSCSRMIPRSSSVAHMENSCKITFPFIQDELAHVTITEVPSSSKLLELPFIDSRQSASVLFLSKEIIIACGLMTSEWVILRADGDASPETAVPVLFRVWPIPDSNFSHRNFGGAYVTQAALSTTAILNGTGPATVQCLTSNAHPFNSFMSLKRAVLQTTCPDDDNLMIPEEEKNHIVENFKRIFKNRPVADGNVFKLPFYTLILEVRVLMSKSHGDVETLEESLKQLTLGNTVLEFFEITNETEFTLQFMGTSAFTTKNPKLATLDDVGGLCPVIDELTSTIRYTLKNSKDLAKAALSAGILLHGHHGTGKSLLTQAVCSSLKLNAIWFEEFGPKLNPNLRRAAVGNNLTEIFTHALRSQPCAVIIENLDVIGTKVSRSDSNSSFISQLRSQIEKMNSLNVEVIVLATCSELEAVDTALRAPHIFGKEIEIPVPALNQREDILLKLLKSFKHQLSSNDIKTIAAITHGFVGADLESLLAQSYLHVLRRNEENTNIIKAITIQDVEECIKIVHPSAMKSILIDVPNVKWDDIGGQNDLKFKLKQAIEWPLKHPESFRRLGITPPKGILMYGPPGCSKTMIAKAIATESGLNFISVKGSELFSKWVGESEKAVRSLFRKARQVSPCIVFFDEIDSFGGERGNSSGSSNVHERVLAQLLIEIDGIEALKDVTIVAATNRPDIIDPALLRPGRLDRIIHVPLPDEETRKEIFKIHFRKMPVSSNINLQTLVDKTERYSGAELTAVCHEAALKALEEDINSAVILESHFIEALRLITPRTSREQIEFYEKFSQSRSKRQPSTI